MKILDALRSEVARRAAGWTAAGITFELDESPAECDSTASFLQLLGPSGFGELAVWSSGEADEGWNTRDGELTAERHHEFLTTEDLGAALDRIARALSAD